MNNCEFVNLISSIACLIAKDKTNEDLALLAAFFTQLGDTLTTISVLNSNRQK